MEELTKLVSKMSIDGFDPGKNIKVHITHIIDPSSFYVRPTAYDQHMEELCSPGDAVQPSDLQECGRAVVFKSRNLKKFTRGFALEAHNCRRGTKYDMLAIDEGFTEELVRISNIYKCKCPFTPPLAHYCRLADCKPIGNGTWTEREIEAMKHYVGNEVARMTVRENEGDILTVELRNTCPDDIATIMALTNYSQMGYGSNTLGRLTEPAPQKLMFTFKSPKVGDVLHVRMQSWKGLDNFYVAEKQDYKTYLDNLSSFKYFSREFSDLTSDELQQDVPVSVRIDNAYERGIVKRVLTPTRAKVQLVDWGKIEKSNIASLKPMSDKFFFYPAIAIYCAVAETEVSDKRLHKYLYPGYEFKIEILEMGKGFVKPNIVKIIPVW